MKTNYNDIDELLVKFLTGEASGEERTEVQQWLRQDEKNRRYYDHFRLIWEESLQLAATTDVDENAAWQRFQQRTQQPAKVRSISWVRIAAAIILVAGLSYLGWYLAGGSNTGVPIATLETINDVKSNTLPDGSLITINKNSSLSWPQQFEGKSRNVQLTGEGFFNVKPNKEKPFIVNAGNNITIEVLGTSFNVKSREDSTEVIVETGNVEVSWLTNKVMLQAGEKVTIKTGQGSAQKQSVNDKLYNYYRSRTFVCDNTPLWKLVQALNEAYETNIIIEKAAARDLPLSVTFKDESLDKILEVVGGTLNLDIIKENGSIILR